MVFSSASFLFLFLPVFLIIYYACPKGLRSAWILAASWVFYGFWRPDFLLLIVATTVWTYVLGLAVDRRTGTPGRGRGYLIAAVVLNIGILAYFKYFNFGVESLNSLFAAIGAGELRTWQVVLPVGISFYVFQATSYVVDVYRRDAPAARSYLDLAAYVSLFPQLIAGPILRYKELSHQLTDREHNLPKFRSGTLRFMVGFVKKVLIADSVAPLADAVFALAAPTMAEAWLGAAAFAIQLYYDFSGYSDMAIGLGRMIGFEFAENFDAPYRSRSITEFWRRWHISLSSWLRDYLYIPLGGSRLGTRRTYVNLLTVMVLGGLWHGAAWTFVAWGAYHGLILVIERRFAGRRSMVPGPFAAVATTILVTIGWVLFRSETISAAAAVYRGMIGLGGLRVTAELGWQLSGVSLAALVAGVIGVYLPAVDPNRLVGRLVTAHSGLSSRIIPGAVAPLFVLGVIKLLAESHSPFLYFQF